MALANAILLPCVIFYSIFYSGETSACSSDTDETCVTKHALTQDALPAAGMAVELLQMMADKPHKGSPHKKQVGEAGHHTSQSKASHDEDKKSKVDDKKLHDADDKLKTVVKELGEENSDKDYMKKELQKASFKDGHVQKVDETTSVSYNFMGEGDICKTKKAKDSTKGHTIDSCKAVCTTSSSCKFFTFGNSGGFCTTYSECVGDAKISTRDAQEWSTYKKVNDKEELEALKQELHHISEEHVEDELPGAKLHHEASLNAAYNAPEQEDSEEAKLQESVVHSKSSKHGSAHGKHAKNNHNKSEKEEAKERLMKLDYMLVANGKWCNNAFDAEKALDGVSANGFTFKSCEAACTKRESCKSFSFDNSTGWCTTYAKCGTPTTNPNGHWQSSKGWMTYEKVFKPQAWHEDVKKEMNISKETPANQTLRKGPEEKHVQEAPQAPTFEYLLAAKGKWCDSDGDAVQDDTSDYKHTLDSCQAACTKSSSCASFSFDAKYAFCNTFKKCGKLTSTPNGKKSTSHDPKKTDGWVTYNKVDRKVAEEARLQEQDREALKQGLDSEFTRLGKGKWCNTKGDAIKNKHGIADQNYTLELCKKQCARSPTCEAFSFDGAIGWCTTFAKCGNVTSTPDGNLQETYVKWSDVADIAIAQGIAAPAPEDNRQQMVPSAIAQAPVETKLQEQASASDSQQASNVVPANSMPQESEPMAATVHVEEPAAPLDPEQIVKKQLEEENLDDPDSDASAQQMQELAERAR